MLSFNIGSTTTFPFILPVDSKYLTKCVITFRQGGENILNKQLNDYGVKTHDKNLIVKMSEEESLLFSKDYTVFVQVKLKIGNNILVSEPVVFDVDNTFYLEQLSEDSPVNAEIICGTIPLIFN